MREDIKRLPLAIGWTLGLQALWGVVLVALVLWLVESDKSWVADNFLLDVYRQKPDDWIDDITQALIRAALATFAAGLVASLAWIVISGCKRISLPGEAARLFGLWLVLLVVAAAASAGFTYYLIAGTITLVPLDKTVILVGTAAFVAAISYYLVGTLLPTQPKVRPAVPFATRLSRAG